MVLFSLDWYGLCLIPWPDTGLSCCLNPSLVLDIVYIASNMLSDDVMYELFYFCYEKGFALAYQFLKKCCCNLLR